jgi:hypothetical protein
MPMRRWRSSYSKDESTKPEPSLRALDSATHRPRRAHDGRDPVPSPGKQDEARSPTKRRSVPPRMLRSRPTTWHSSMLNRDQARRRPATRDRRNSGCPITPAWTIPLAGFTTSRTSCLWPSGRLKTALEASRQARGSLPLGADLRQTRGQGQVAQCSRERALKLDPKVGVMRPGVC